MHFNVKIILGITERCRMVLYLFVTYQSGMRCPAITSSVCSHCRCTRTWLSWFLLTVYSAFSTSVGRWNTWGNAGLEPKLLFEVLNVLCNILYKQLRTVILSMQTSKWSMYRYMTVHNLIPIDWRQIVWVNKTKIIWLLWNVVLWRVLYLSGYFCSI